ncbi:Serine--tRNA ligase, cytoplasmic [Linum perenne]
MLDINLFREDKGNNPEIIRQSQRFRFANVEIVDEIIKLDKEWRQRQFELDNLRKDFNKINKQVAKLKIADNKMIRNWGEKRTGMKFKSHVDLVELLGIADLKKAGSRGYYLKGDGVLLNQALINYGLAFLRQRKYTPLQTPFFMTKDIMAKCAQLAQFDEELYKVTGEGEDKYLIATAEQPLCAYHIDDWIHPTELPIRYVGYSSCFRKEAGSHGRDTLGIFRVHQFEKLEQPKQLNLPYQVIAIVSGALNDAAAKKFDLEAWFPGSSTYRELVSCSNCTDYQSRRLEIRYGQKKSNEAAKQYVHLLNSTLTATERTMCCILENYQKEDGVEIPEVLRPYMGGISFMPFQKGSKGKKAK